MLTPGQRAKKQIVVRPAAIVNNASLTTYVIDTLGFASLDVDVILGASDIALTALKLQESDSLTDATTLGGTATDVPGCVFGTSLGISGDASALPSATDDNKVFSFNVDLRGRKRYLKLVATVGNGSTGAFVSAVATLAHPEVKPSTAAERGVGDALMAP